jgi:hypothetical protein
MQDREVESAKDANIREVHDDARMCVPVKSRILGAAGRELHPKTPMNPHISNQRGTESGR